MSYLEEHRNELFKKYTTEELIKDVESFKSGKGRLTKVLNHFFEEIIFECKGVRGDMSPMEALQDDSIMKSIIEYVESKPNFYTGKEEANVKSFFRNAGRIASKVANFDPKNARDIYNRYSNKKNKNVLDMSAGFGSRMSGALLSGNHYCGFEPNKKLHKKLEEYYKFLKDNKLTENYSRVYCQGSEIFIPQLEGKFDVSFTSPPYFDIEEYSQDEGQSIVKFKTYEEWTNGFAIPTIHNTYKYLKVGGYAMVNIKNIARQRNGTGGKKEKLFDDWMEIFKSIDGFEFVEVFEIKHQAKKNYFQNGTYDESLYKGFKEPVMVFKKIK